MADSKFIADMQGKLNTTLQIDDPLKVKEVLQESEEFGDAVDVERKALHEKYDGLIQAAEDEMKEVADGADFSDMMETMMRYENDYASYEATDKYRSAKQAWTDLRSKWDTLLEETKTKLRAEFSATDPNAIDKVLEDYEQEYGSTIESEVKALTERKQVLFRTAGTEMQALAAKKDATVEEFDKALEKYKDWGEGVRVARDKLMSEHRVRLSSLASEVGELLKGQDFAAVSAQLEKNTATMETHMKDKLEQLTRHRQTLIEKTSDLLKKGVNETHPTKISQILQEAEPFGETVEAERSALQAEYEKHIQTANDEMAQLAQEDGADKFKAMTEALAKYEDFPGEETQKQHKQLKEHWDVVLERTKGELRDLIAATNPNEIKDKLAEYDGYAAYPVLL